MSKPRPLMFGYLRVQRLLSDARTAHEVRTQFEEFAHVEGYALAGIFVDQDHTAPAGFDGLVQAVKQYDARAVVVPTLEHLAVLGPRGRRLDRLVANATGAQVLAMGCQLPRPL